jgi:hypothetical protein
MAKERLKSPRARLFVAMKERRGPLPKDLSPLFGGVRLTLYRSQIQPQGAQYTPLAQVELPIDGRQ